MSVTDVDFRVLRYVHLRNWEVFAMADELMEELWKIKDELSRKCGGDLRAYCDYLNRAVSIEGFEVVDRSRPPQMKVAEDAAEYKAGKQ